MSQEEVMRLSVQEILEVERKLEMISQDPELRVELIRRRMAHHDAVSLTEDSRYEGVQEGERMERCQGIMDLCEIFGVELTAERRAQLEDLSLDELEEVRQHLKQQRTWPQD